MMALAASLARFVPGWRPAPAAPLSEVVAALLARLQVPVTRSTLEEALEAHPAFPSLAAIRDALEELGVETRALRADPAQLSALPLPALVQLHQGRLVLVDAVADGRVQGVDPATGPFRQDRAAFARAWSGVALLAHPRPGAGEPDYPQQRRLEQLRRLRWPSVLLLGAAALGAVALGAGTLGGGALGGSPLGAGTLGGGVTLGGIAWGALLALQLVGLGLSAVLAGHTAFGGGLLNRLCPASGQGGCAGVLASAAARLGGVIPVADLGLIYFAGGSLVLWGAGRVPPEFFGLVLAALPYSLLAIAQQALVLRQACRLCVLVHAVLALEATLLFLLDAPLALPGAPALAAFSGVAAAWIALRPALAAERAQPALRRALRRVSADPQVLAAALARRPPVELGSSPVLVLGPADGVRLSVVARPTCAACAAAHQRLEQLRQAFPTLRLELQLLAPADEGPAARVARRVLALATRDAEAAWEALSAWYRDPRDPAAWSGEHPLPPTTEPGAGERLRREAQAWAAARGIQATPAVFLGGAPLQLHELPQLGRLLRTLSAAPRDPRSA